MVQHFARCAAEKCLDFRSDADFSSGYSSTCSAKLYDLLSVLCPKRMCKQALLDKLASREAVIAVVGLGYVGLPLSLAYAKKGFRVKGVDLDRRKVESIIIELVTSVIFK